MAYPKPLSEKTLLRMYAEAKISNEKKQFLHSGVVPGTKNEI